MDQIVRLVQLEEQPLAVVRGHTTLDTLPATIRALFDRFYTGFQGKGGLNTVLYSACNTAGEMEIACGVQITGKGNAAIPAGLALTAAHIGPYHLMKPAHDAIHRWAKDNGQRLTGVSWEVYGHWTDDPAQLRTDIFYQLAQ